MILPFLIGVLVTMLLTAALFFLRFWKDTRDISFPAFAAYFTIEGLTCVPLLFALHPGEGPPWIYWVRLLGLFFILGAILGKNLGR